MTNGVGDFVTRYFGAPVSYGASVVCMRRLLQNLILTGVSLSLTFAIAEVILRIYNPFDFRIRGDTIVLPANRKYEIRNASGGQLDPIILHTKNSLGFRGPEPPPDFGAALTIIAVGGSTTESFYVSDHQTWPYRLGERLAQTFDGVWVNNAGISGLSTYGQLILLKDYIVRLRPKVALFLVGVNDLGRAEAGGADVGLTPQGMGLVRSLVVRSEVATLVVNLVRHVRGRAWTAGQQGDLRTSPKYSGNVDEQAVRAEHRTRFLPAYGDRLREHIRIARASGIEPIFLTQPALFGDAIDDVTGVSLGELNAFEMRGSFAWELLDSYNEATRAVGREYGVLVIDLARRLEKSSRYYYDGTHYTNAGSDRASLLIDEELCPFLAVRFPAFVRGACSR